MENKIKKKKHKCILNMANPLVVFRPRTLRITHNLKEFEESWVL